MSDVKQVKVDNWGIYFLQRLKHFFNRTDYCDLTLQFQDNAQLKVHRLVLNACTEYFELLERTCEMYEDCLVMPDDLQADVVVPIVNFMYTGQLEFRMDALERLYQTSQVMNMPVLSKLLEAHRDSRSNLKNSAHYGMLRRFPKTVESSRQQKYSTPIPSSSGKRTFSKAFESNKTPNSKSVDRSPLSKTSKTSNKEEVVIYRDRKLHVAPNKSKPGDTTYRGPSPIPLDSSLYNKRLVLGEPRPTRYELPEELDTDNIFDNSFSNISYTSQPLMVHPETTKQYSSKKSSSVFNEATSSKKIFRNTVDIVECKKVTKNDSIYEDDVMQNTSDDLYQSAFLSMKDTSLKDPGQLFDQILDNTEGSPKVTIESKDKQIGNLDHAKIISEVLKKYPHLVKSNKNIKLKILNTPNRAKRTRTPTVSVEEFKEKPKEGAAPYTYETDVLDSKEAAKLISLGAENIKGPWICLICGTPGRALNFTSYYNFRRHLVEVHKEKPVSTICEHCGLKSYKRNYLLHHIYTKHGVPPPPQYNFPKCPTCDYIALTEGFLIKHKLTHSETKITHRCLVCSQVFASRVQLVMHIEKTGHKQQFSLSHDKKQSIQCTYCMKVFLRDNNFYCHLKTAHKEQAIRDGVIEDSDGENKLEETNELKPNVKHEHPNFETELDDEDIQYERPPSTHVAKKPLMVAKNVNISQKILNIGFNPSSLKQIQKPKALPDLNAEFIHEIENPSQGSEGNIVLINDIEYIMKDNQLIPRKSPIKQGVSDEYILSDFMPPEDQRMQNLETVTPTTSMDTTNLHSAEIVQQPKMILKKSATINQPIQIVVSNEEEYKALMASNHSIIFDDGDTNKTLTVLTAPQNTTMESTNIELDNTQSNEMMIIQEDYPLTVSEPVSAENSKYVVVYSHAMDHNDPTKQFQIITPQEIGAQYVQQTSAVLTQNYDTITTSASVVNANVLGTQIEDSWHQNSHHNVESQATILVAPATEIQAITEPNVKTNVNENTLIAEILPIPTKTSMVQLEQIEENVEQPNEVTLEPVTTINPEQMVVEDDQANTVEDMNIEISTDVITDKADTPAEETQITTEHEIETDQECPEDMVANIAEPCDPSATVQEQLVEDQLAVQHQVESSVTIGEQAEISLPVEQIEIGEQSSEINENPNNEDIEPNETIIEETPQSQENMLEEASPQTENVAPVQPKEQIQNLTSEWSEDEYDTIMEEPENNAAENKIADASSQEPELEESIENIQQEVQKPMSDVEESDVAAEVENFPNPNEDITNLNQTKPAQPNTVIINAEATQEKISSLLNDWEDSQEDSASINENGDDNSATIDSNENVTDANTNTNENDTGETTETEIAAKATVDTKKDNIKSLVSDWDEEDEENKE